MVITVTSASPKERYKMAQIKSAKPAGHDGYTGVTFQNGSEQKLSMQAKMQWCLKIGQIWSPEMNTPFPRILPLWTLHKYTKYWSIGCMKLRSISSWFEFVISSQATEITTAKTNNFMFGIERKVLIGKNCARDLEYIWARGLIFFFWNSSF